MKLMQPINPNSMARDGVEIDLDLFICSIHTHQKEIKRMNELRRRE